MKASDGVVVEVEAALLDRPPYTYDHVPVCNQQPARPQDDREGDLHLDRGPLPLLPAADQALLEELHPPQPVHARHVHTRHLCLTGPSDPRPIVT